MTAAPPVPWAPLNDLHAAVDAAFTAVGCAGLALGDVRDTEARTAALEILYARVDAYDAARAVLSAAEGAS